MRHNEHGTDSPTMGTAWTILAGFSLPAFAAAFTSAAMMSLHTAMHSSQIKTDGPAINLCARRTPVHAERGYLEARNRVFRHALPQIPRSAGDRKPCSNFQCFGIIRHILQTNQLRPVYAGVRRFAEVVATIPADSKISDKRRREHMRETKS